MKISIVTFLYLPQFLGGTEIATFNLAKYLAEQGHEVHVITRGGKNVPKHSFEDGFKVHRPKITEIRFLEYVDFWIKIFFIFKNINPDIIHFQSILIALPGFFIKKIFRKPIIIYGRGSDVYIKTRLIRFFHKLNLKTADVVIVLTKHMEKELLNIHKRKIYVIPNGIKLKRFHEHSKEEIREILKMDKNQKFIIYVGNLREIKGVKYLICAFSDLIGKCNGIKLIIIGEGKERQSLENLVEELKVKDDVEFLGKIYNKEIPKYLTSSDVFVLPSLSEGFPNVVLEAMASGLPIIASNVGGINEIIENQENGFLVDPCKPKEISKFLMILLTDLNLNSKISANNLKKVRRYELKLIHKDIEKIYLSQFNTSEPPLS